MLTFRMPSLYCPFPTRINPDIGAIDRRIFDWIQTHELFSADVCAHLPSARYAELVARAFPSADHTALDLVTDWNVWLFARDDFLIETKIGAVPDQLVAFNRYLLDILRGKAVTRTDLALGQTLGDFTQRLRQITGAASLKRFTQAAEDHFQANVWEAMQYTQGRLPDLATYCLMRPFTGAMYTELALIEIAGHFELSLALHQHPLIRRLKHLTCRVVCFANDIFSLTKEARDGESLNLVCVLQHQYGLSVQAAVNRAATMHDADVRTFERIEARLWATGLMVDANLRCYVDGLRAWMRGNLDWSITSGRYNVVPQMQEVAV